MRFFDVVLLLLAFRPQGWRPPGGPQGPGHGPPGPLGYLKSVEMMDLEFKIINWFMLEC